MKNYRVVCQTIQNGRPLVYVVGEYDWRWIAVIWAALTAMFDDWAKTFVQHRIKSQEGIPTYRTEHGNG